MNKRFVIFLITLMIVTGGCWDWRIFDELAIVFGMGIDPVENEPEAMLISFESPVFNPDAEEKRVVRTIKGYSLQQILFNLQHQKDLQPVLGKVGVIIFSEETARNGGMQKILMQYHEIRDNSPNAWVCIVKQNMAQEVLNLKLPDQPRPAVFLAHLLQQNYSQGRIPQLTASIYWTRLHTRGITPVIPLIELAGPEGEDPNEMLLAGLAVVDEAGRMSGSLTDAETLLYMMLTNEALRGRFSSKIEFKEQANRVVTAFIQKSSSSVNTKIQEDQAVIEIKTEIVLNGVTAELMLENVLSEEVFRELEEALARDIQANMISLIKKTQEWESDIFGFGQLVRSQHSQWFKDKRWGREYSKTKIAVEVKVRIKRLGLLTSPVR